MNFAPLINASPLTWVHVAATLLALASGLVVVASAKGTSRHAGVGRVFAGAMIVAALTSFGLTTVWPGHYSPIHILSLVTLVTVPWAILQRWKGNIRRHAIGMSLNFVGLVVAGLFALAPGRVMGQLFHPIAVALGF